MTERAIRSTHALPSTPRRRLGRVAISVALTAIASIVLGIQGTPGAHASDERRSDRSLKAKALTAFPQESSQRTHGTQFREGKYTVIVGDTVSQIAASAGVSTAELLGANGLSWKTLIFAGQLLDIPHHAASGRSWRHSRVDWALLWHSASRAHDRQWPRSFEPTYRRSAPCRSGRRRHGGTARRILGISLRSHSERPSVFLAEKLALAI